VYYKVNTTHGNERGCKVISFFSSKLLRMKTKEFKSFS